VANAAQSARDTKAIGPLLRTGRGAADRLLIRIQRPPLSAAVGDAELSGFLRHKSFLEDVATNSYERLALQLVLERIQPGVTVIDGGAHIGLYTVLASARAGPSGTVYALEPDPYNYAALRINVQRNRLTNVNTLNQALAAGVGSGTFHASSGTIAGSLVDKSYVHDTRRILARTTTVDAVLGAGRDEIVGKLDLEGGEEPALRGADRVLRETPRARLLIEHNPTALRDAGSSGQALIDLLHDYGFEVSFVDEENGALVPVESAPKPLAKGNLLADKGP
jgi:FkbM family methyltransferase